VLLAGAARSSADRYAVYLYVDDSQRQLCLATSCATSASERAPGRTGAPGPQARQRARRRLRDAQPPGGDRTDLAAQTLCLDLSAPCERIRDLLGQGTCCRDRKTRRFCRGLLDHESALWTFTRLPGVPDTNNAAERALRHAVQWRKTSYGTQADHGDRLVDRLLTMRETCRLQGRGRLHDYLTSAITADLLGLPSPALLAPP